MNLDNLVECVIHTVSISNVDSCIHVNFFIISHERKNLILTACNTSDFLLNGMREQNIIDSIHIFDSDEMENEDTKYRLFYLVNGKQFDSKENLSLAWKLIDKKIEDIRLSQQIMVEIEEVAGASVLLIADKLVLSESNGVMGSEIPSSHDLILWESRIGGHLAV